MMMSKIIFATERNVVCSIWSYEKLFDIDFLVNKHKLFLRYKTVNVNFHFIWKVVGHFLFHSVQ